MTTMTTTTMMTATMQQEEELNDREPIMSEEEEDEEEMVASNDGRDDGENEVASAFGGNENGTAALVSAPATIVVCSIRDESAEEEKPDAKEEDTEDNSDIDVITEGRDDNSNEMDSSIEVQPNEKRSVLALVSEGVVDRVQSSHQRRALFLLDARGVPYEKVDGMDPAQREVRDGLFELAGFGGGAGCGAGGGAGGDTSEKKRSKKPVSYPQFFFVGDGTISYVGDFERLLNLNDASDIPREILDQHPDLETWERVFVNLVEPAEIASP
mmetsp:Transcript_11289/g.31911  ORF Transcript_11289/g.31911 Transcript_11289/m.31911 type:complete len:270 (+) Transcript_11289:247-1056(+)